MTNQQNAFQVTKGMAIGRSPFCEEGAKIVPRLMEKATAKNVHIHLPEDFVAADKFDESAAVGEATVDSGINNPWIGLDVGPKSSQKFADIVKG